MIAIAEFCYAKVPQIVAGLMNVYGM